MHEQVRHPHEIIAEAQACESWLVRVNDTAATWITDHVLASLVMFDAALIVPLVILPMPDSAKLVLAVVSSNWIQWWALPALQRSQNKIQARQDAKADVDHKTLTYLATIQDEQLDILKRLDGAK